MENNKLKEAMEKKPGIAGEVFDIVFTEDMLNRNDILESVVQVVFQMPKTYKPTKQEKKDFKWNSKTKELTFYVLESQYADFEKQVNSIINGK